MACSELYLCQPLDESYHKGADICAAYGTPIIASDSGKVVTAGWHYSYGNYVIIDHGNGYRTLYAHMSQLKCTAGQAVNQGDVIGLVGSTGDSYRQPLPL